MYKSKTGFKLCHFIFQRLPSFKIDVLSSCGFLVENRCQVPTHRSYQRGIQRFWTCLILQPENRLCKDSKSWKTKLPKRNVVDVRKAAFTPLKKQRHHIGRSLSDSSSKSVARDMRRHKNKSIKLKIERSVLSLALSCHLVY